MANEPYNPTSEYQPESTIDLPVLFAWPPRPVAAIRYLFFDMLFPWGYLYVAMAFISWFYLTPALDAMTQFAPGWIATIWLRNAFWLTLVAGGLHWWLYMRRGQGNEYKFHERWLAILDAYVHHRITSKDYVKTSLALLRKHKDRLKLNTGDTEHVPQSSPLPTGALAQRAGSTRI